MIPHSGIVVGACPICGSMVGLRASWIRDAWHGDCASCTCEVFAHGTDVRSALERRGDHSTGVAGLYRVRQKLDRLWAISFPCKGRQ